MLYLVCFQMLFSIELLYSFLPFLRMPLQKLLLGECVCVCVKTHYELGALGLKTIFEANVSFLVWINVKILLLAVRAMENI